MLARSKLAPCFIQFLAHWGVRRLSRQLDLSLLVSPIDGAKFLEATAGVGVHALGESYGSSSATEVRGRHHTRQTFGRVQWFHLVAVLDEGVRFRRKLWLLGQHRFARPIARS